MTRCSLPEGSVIVSIKLPNMMQIQETLTGSTFDHLFSFFAIFNNFSRAIPCQVNSAQILDANSHSGEKQLCQNLEESVKYFSSYAPPKNLKFTHKIGLDRYIASIFDPITSVII